MKNNLLVFVIIIISSLGLTASAQLPFKAVVVDVGTGLPVAHIKYSVYHVIVDQNKKSEKVKFDDGYTTKDGLIQFKFNGVYTTFNITINDAGYKGDWQTSVRASEMPYNIRLNKIKDSKDELLKLSIELGKTITFLKIQI